MNTAALKRCLLLVLAMTMTSIGRAQTMAPAPEVVVKNLYAAQKSGQDAPFNQFKKRASVDKYFANDLAGLIWKDAVEAKGEVGALDFDPLFNAQDTEVASFLIGKPNLRGADTASVPVTFKNFGKGVKIRFELAREPNGPWKIANIVYDNGHDLKGLLTASLHPKGRKKAE